MPVEINEVVIGHKSLRQSLTERGWNIRYIRSQYSLGYSGDNEITVVYQVGTKFGGDVVKFFYSVCNPKDNFDRNIGVQVALEKQEYNICAKGCDIETEVLEYILENDKRSSVKRKIHDYLMYKRDKELRKIRGDHFN